MEPNYYSWVHVKAKGFFQKWKKNFGAVYQRSQYGVERLEIYPSEQDFSQAKHGRTILLMNCISIRYVESGNSQVPCAVQVTINDTKNGQIMLGATNEDDAQEWQEALCRAAFPDQYAKVTGPLLNKTNNGIGNIPPPGPSSPLFKNPEYHHPPPGDAGSKLPQETTNSTQNEEESTYDTPWDVQQVRVLLISTPSSHRLGLSEGTYDLAFGAQGVILKAEGAIVEAWNYSLISWFGYGSSVCSFETEGNQSFEFKCARPDYVYERLRNQVKLKPCPNHQQPPGLKQTYYAHYAPLDKIIPPVQSPRRTIFAPRASIDTALPGIYNKPQSPPRHSISPPLLPLKTSKSKAAKKQQEQEKQTAEAEATDQGKSGRSRSLPPGAKAQKKGAEGANVAPPGSPQSMGSAEASETSFGKRKSRFRSLFGGSRRGKKHDKSRGSDVSNSSSILSDERVDEWTFQTGDQTGVGVALMPPMDMEAPPPVPEKRPEAYISETKPLPPPRQQDPLIEQLNRKLAERKESAAQMPPPFPPVQEEPEGTEESIGVMPDVVDVNYRRQVSGQSARLRDSVTSEPGSGSPRYFSVRNAVIPTRPQIATDRPLAGRETTFERDHS